VEHGVDLLHVRRDDHKPQTDPLPGALQSLPRHNVRNLEVAVGARAEGLGALIVVAHAGNAEAGFAGSRERSRSPACPQGRAPVGRSR
jgi:hypothetical protein